MADSDLEDKYFKYNFDDDEEDLEDKYSKFNFDDDEDEDEDDSSQPKSSYKKPTPEQLEASRNRIIEGTGFDMRFRKKKKRRVRKSRKKV